MFSRRDAEAQRWKKFRVCLGWLTANEREGTPIKKGLDGKKTWLTKLPFDAASKNNILVDWFLVFIRVYSRSFAVSQRFFVTLAENRFILWVTED
jgi:hypothetical protein